MNVFEIEPISHNVGRLMPMREATRRAFGMKAARPLLLAGCSGVYLGGGGTTPASYDDVINHTIGPAQFDSNTTRVDAFGVRLARLQCADGFVATIGENVPTSTEDRAATLARFITNFLPSLNRSRNEKLRVAS